MAEHRLDPGDDNDGHGRERHFRRFCRGASVAFLLVVVYTVAVKLPAGELGRDWMHSVLHVASGLLAVGASLPAARPWAARAFTLGILAVYGPLSIAGWFIDGLAMQTVYRIPLQPADNIFHLLLAVTALATIGFGHRASRAALE